MGNEDGRERGEDNAGAEGSRRRRNQTIVKEGRIEEGETGIARKQEWKMRMGGREGKIMYVLRGVEGVKL